jgi:predicted RNase H-like nuclease (RuvC/YqgF family)
MTLGATITASGHVWRPTAPINERIETLRTHITEVEGHLNEVAHKLRQETSSRDEAIAELDRTLKAETAELRRLLEEKDREMARIDARGLPLIGYGIVLSGVPEFLASPLGTSRG